MLFDRKEQSLRNLNAPLTMIMIMIMLVESWSCQSLCQDHLSTPTSELDFPQSSFSILFLPLTLISLDTLIAYSHQYNRHGST